MKISLHTGDERKLEARQPYAGADHVLVDAACPAAGCAPPLKVGGSGRRIESHDTYAADAFCMCCGARVGTLRVVCSTIFGVEEDERVLNGRCRVY